MSVCDSSDHLVSNIVVIVFVVNFFHSFHQTGEGICIKFCFNISWVYVYQDFRNWGATLIFMEIIDNFVFFWQILEFDERSFSVKPLTRNNSYVLVR